MNVRLEDLTGDQRCVLLNAVEETFLFSVLMECAPGADWPDLMPHVPYVRQIVEDFINKGLVTLYRNTYEPGHPPVDIPNDQAHAVLADLANWWTSEGVRPISLAATDQGLAVYTGHSVAVPDADPH